MKSGSFTCQIPQFWQNKGTFDGKTVSIRRLLNQSEASNLAGTVVKCLGYTGVSTCQIFLWIWLKNYAKRLKLE